MRTYLISPDEKLIYCIVPKNASTTMLHQLKAVMGWTYQSGIRWTPPEDAIFFSHIQDPITRWKKGVTQYLIQRHWTASDIERRTW